jgi:hypothetical protein
MNASKFKKKFLDKMNFDDIYDFASAVDESQLDQWFINLIGEDYKHLTEAEWKAFFYQVDDSHKIVDFVNAVIKKDPKIIINILDEMTKKNHKMGDDQSAAWGHVEKYIEMKKKAGVKLQDLVLNYQFYRELPNFEYDDDNTTEYDDEETDDELADLPDYWKDMSSNIKADMQATLEAQMKKDREHMREKIEERKARDAAWRDKQHHGRLLKTTRNYQWMDNMSQQSAQQKAMVYSMNSATLFDQLSNITID